MCIDSSRLSRRELQFLRVWQIIAGERRFRGLPELPAPLAQYRFAPPRKWRFDFAWLARKLAVEIDGGTRGRPVVCHRCGTPVRARKANGNLGRIIMQGGRHNNPSGYATDREKHNAAVVLGWRVLTATTEMLNSDPTGFAGQVVAALECDLQHN